MLRRTIVSIEQDGNGGLVAKLLRAEKAIPDGRRPHPLSCDPVTLPPLDHPANVKAYGKQLHDALTQHPAIQVALQDLFLTPPGESRTLCFEIQASEGEQIRWEALCDGNEDFVALGGRLQMGRIADEVFARDVGVRPYSLPVRLVAFLSPAGVDADPEWQSLASAIAAARAQGLPLVAEVYLGQQEILDRVRAEQAQGRHEGVVVQAMPIDELGVEDVLNKARPHLVHFFCHGLAGFGAAHLELATIVDHDLKQPSGSVLASVSALVDTPGLRDAWLVVLNCCEGAQANERLNSMAFRMVADGGVPAAIGMLEPVAAGDATAFCRSLYPALFSLLAKTVAATATTVDRPIVVDLTSVLVPSRRALHSRHLTTPAAFGRWTLPVLYVQREPLRLHRVATAPPAATDAVRTRVELIAHFLRQLPPDTPDGVRDETMAMFDEPPLVPPHLRPDRLGRFDANT